MPAPLALEGTRWQYLQGARQPQRISPDAWLVDQALLDRPGNREIRLQLFYSYRTTRRGMRNGRPTSAATSGRR